MCLKDECSIRTQQVLCVSDATLAGIGDNQSCCRGHSVSRTALEAAFAPTAVPMCQKNCNLDSVSFCIGRDEAGERLHC